MSTGRKIIEIPAEYLPEIDELPGDLKRIGAAVEEVSPGEGVRIALLLGQLFPGVPLYPHNVQALARRIRDDAIRAEYDQGEATAKSLAIKNRLSLRRIEQILAQPPSQDELKNKQMRMF